MNARMIGRAVAAIALLSLPAMPAHATWVAPQKPKPPEHPVHQPPKPSPDTPAPGPGELHVTVAPGHPNGSTLLLAVQDLSEPRLDVIHVPAVPEVSNAGVHYRPRRSRWGRAPEAASVSQIHLGFFDPDGTPARRFLVGIRGGPMIDRQVQLGVGIDWAHDSDNTSSVSSETTGPGGTPITIQRDLSRASTDLFPIMAFLQVSAPDNMSVVPYFGVAGGYQLLNLSADDYLTGDSFDATYGGWGWQVWGGLAMPLSGRTRLTGEVFVNGAELSRDVNDPYYGVYGSTYRETVKQDGVGARFGIAWGF